MEKYTHQLFKEYLLSEESLSPDQSRALQEHMRECAECRQQEAAWTNVERVFHRAEVVMPAEGFTARWQDRLAARRLTTQRKRAWIFFSVTAGIAVILSALLIFGAVQAFSSPLQLLSKAVYFLVMTFFYYRRISEFVGNMNLALPLLSIALLVFFTGFVSIVSVLWAVMYRKLSSSRRVNI